ncbi:unnamed protein product [Gemmataceae bacterium]|nr:unnamed protein product [Gemmataceae bacterium]VTT99262.1 unnamed protein product [Gemmataceae bacterium]
MRVIEQLAQHFWARGALTREEAQYLVGHGFVREGDLPGFVEDNAPSELAGEEPDPRFDPKAREAEQLEDELTGRNSAGGRRGKKKKPAGHNVAPLASHLGSHLTGREPFPALHELGQRLTPCADWRGAARAVAAAEPDDLEAALVAVLNARPRALGELWFWFDVEPVFEWAERGDNSGPVADAIGKLLRADTPGRVGRLDQLLKVPEVQALTDLLAARGAFLAALPGLFVRQFDKLGQWLVPPAAGAAGPWPALPWAFVLLYNARKGTADVPPPGYPVDPHQLAFEVLKAALVAAFAMDRAAVRALLIHQIRERPEAIPDSGDLAKRAVFDRPLHCPYSWKV